MKGAQGAGGDGDHAEPTGREIYIIIIIIICSAPFLMTKEMELEEPGLFSKMVLVICLEE